MPFTTPDYSDIRDAILRDIANQLPDASVGEDSDYYLRAAAVGAAIEGLYEHQQWIARQILPDTADSDYLQRWASLYDIAPKAAAAANGSLTLTGTPATVVPVGTEARRNDGTAYVTTATGTLAEDGTLTVAAAASAAGAAGNADAGTGLTLTAAPAGVDSTATVLLMTGGADVESPAGLLARLLTRIRQPPQGGAAHDYTAWALAVPGVAYAYVFPLRRGLGTVDVVVLPETGLPGSGLIADVQTAIDAVKPVTADCLVLGPAAVPVDVTVTLTLSGTTLAAAQTSIETALASYFATLTPGATAVRNKIAALISDTAGVVDFDLVAPAANVTTTVDETGIELATLGTVTLT